METILSTGKETVSFKKVEDLVHVSVIVNGKVTHRRMVSQINANFNISLLKTLGYKEKYGT